MNLALAHKAQKQDKNYMKERKLVPSTQTLVVGAYYPSHSPDMAMNGNGTVRAEIGGSGKGVLELTVLIIYCWIIPSN